MAEAKVQLPSGAVATVSGTPQEVAEILSTFAVSKSAPEVEIAKKKKSTIRRQTERAGSGVQKLVLDLKTEGYFTGQRRGLNDVQGALEGKGHIFPVTTLSPAMIRLVRSKELRRLKEDGKWMYTHSQ
jgi:hypothetical protein